MSRSGQTWNFGRSAPEARRLQKRYGPAMAKYLVQLYSAKPQNMPELKDLLMEYGIEDDIRDSILRSVPEDIGR